MIVVYTAAEAATALKTARERIDAACASGALVAVDDSLSEKSTKKRWRILEADLIDWHHRGRPVTAPERAA